MKTKDWFMVGIGALIGILLARQFGSSWIFGIVAAIVAGLFGYFSDEPLAKWSSFKLAVRHSKSELAGIKNPFKGQFTVRKDWGALVLAPVLLMVSYVSWLLLFEANSYAITFNLFPSHEAWQMLLGSVMGGVFSLVLLVWLILIGKEADFIDVSDVNLPCDSKFACWLGLLSSPLAALVVAFCWVCVFCISVCGVAWLMLTSWSPLLWRFAAKTTKRFFLYAHTEKSLCRGIYACMGAVIGWYFDRNPFVGFVAGILVGVVAHTIAMALKASIEASKAPQIH